MGYVSKKKNYQMKARGNVYLVNYSDFNPLQSTSFHYNFPPFPFTQGFQLINQAFEKNSVLK